MTDKVTAQAAQVLLAAFDDNRQLPPLSENASLSLDQGYAIAAGITALRRGRGEIPVGRKIGFTNPKIWPIYNVHAPIWGWVWDTTLHDIPASGHIVLPPRPELRIEPEIVFGLGRTPDPEMTATQLWACVDWVAHGVEIVTSLYPGWHFTAADTAAAMAMHAGLWIGPRHSASAVDPDSLTAMTLTLVGPGTSLVGHGHDVLDGPLYALHHLVRDTAQRVGAAPLQGGEIVTTGTLTDAPRIAPGQTWTTRIQGTGLSDLDLTLV
jgi:2-oxo-3-hexenedioate decarboxylase